jgi:hypothetical protein
MPGKKKPKKLIFVVMVIQTPGWRSWCSSIHMKSWKIVSMMDNHLNYDKGWSSINMVHVGANFEDSW